MTSKKIHLWFLGVTCISSLLFSQQFKHITATNGLSQNSIVTMVQDDLGLLWLGTEDGLNRYNGTTFEIFRKDFSDSTSLYDNEINKIVYTKNKEYYLATPSGISILKDPFNGVFSLLQHSAKDTNSLAHNYCLDMIESKSGIIWVATASGVSAYNPITKTFKNYKNTVLDTLVLPRNRVFEIFEDSYGNILISTTNGIALYDAIHDRFKTIKLPYLVNLFFEDSKKQLWLGTSTGFIRYNLEKRRLIGDPIIKEASITAVSEYAENDIWLGTNEHGIIRLNPSTEQTSQLLHDEKDSYSLKNNQTYSLMKGNHGIMWVGSRVGGLSKYDPNAVIFDHITSDIYEKNSLSSKLIWSVIEDRNGNLWVGTADAGLNRIDAKTGKVTVFQHDEKNKLSLPHNEILSLFEDRDGFIWVSTYSEGLVRINPQTYHFTFFNKETLNSRTSINYIRKIVQDANGNLWLGSLYGFFKLNINSNQVDFFLIDSTKGAPYTLNTINDLAIEDDFLWIGSEYSGLYKFDFKKQTLGLYHKSNLKTDNTNYILSIYRDKYHSLWIGTLQGLIRINIKSGEKYIYTLKDGLPNECIYGIVDDGKDGIWVSTNMGISKIHHIESENVCIDNYDHSNNIQSYEFNQFAYAKGASGKLYFGGVNGLNIIEPEQFSKRLFEPKTVISQVHLSNQSYSIHNAKAPTSFSYTEQLIRFDFYGLQYTEPHKVKYEYQLKGFSDEWVSLGNQANVSFMNLAGGKYTFNVRSFINNSARNTLASYTFNIIPPFWKTIPFYTFSILLILICIYFYIKYTVHRIKLDNLKLEQKVDVRTRVISEKINELSVVNNSLETALGELQSERQKNQTMIEMIVHDLKNPLNNILTLSQQAAPTNEVEIINQAGNQILNLSMNLLETAKFEHNALKIQQDHYNLHKISVDAFSQVRLLAKQKSIQFTNQINPSTYVYVDYDIILRVMVNLFTNAIKNTPYGGSMDIKTHLEKKCVRILVSDTGRGIPADMQERIFSKYTQVENLAFQNVRSTGIGLTFCRLAIEKHLGKIWVESVENKHTTFGFTLQLSKVQNQMKIPQTQEANKAHTLSSTDKQCASSLIEQLLPYEIYETSEIIHILENFKTDSETLKSWAEKVKYAALNLEEVHYKKLQNIDSLFDV
jgi:ligand-binding sensor domain-containing protein/signal transduction histidine kinase